MVQHFFPSLLEEIFGPFRINAVADPPLQRGQQFHPRRRLAIRPRLVGGNGRFGLVEEHRLIIEEFPADDHLAGEGQGQEVIAFVLDGRIEGRDLPLLEIFLQDPVDRQGLTQQAEQTALFFRSGVLHQSLYDRALRIGQFAEGLPGLFVDAFPGEIGLQLPDQVIDRFDVLLAHAAQQDFQLVHEGPLETMAQVLDLLVNPALFRKVQGAEANVPFTEHGPSAADQAVGPVSQPALVSRGDAQSRLL